MITLLIAAGALAQSGPIEVQGKLVHPNYLLVKVRKGVNEMRVDEAHAFVGGRVIRDIPQIGWQVVEVPSSQLVSAKRAYERMFAFEQVQFDRAKRLAYDPNDPLWGDMWHMRRIRANLAWDTQKGNATVKIAIMDTGINVAHEDLAANIWVNPGEIPNNNVDDDGNGYIDDVNGYDFAYNDGNPDDVHGHGTGCAGLAAGVQDNNLGITGVAPGCKLVAVKAARDDGYFFDSANVPALVYCGDMGFKVVSMSFYSDEVTPAERDAIDYAWSHGVLPVAAAGNDSQVLPYYPAAYDNTLAVAATNTNDNKAGFSNWGSWVNVAAPGTSLVTTSRDGGYGGFAGTSGACPHVAGLAGLLFSANPNATNAQVRAAIEDTASPTVQQPYGAYTNYGFIRCDFALARVLGQSSGSVPARFIFAEPIGGGLNVLNNGRTEGQQPIMILYGVGFESPNNVRVLRNGIPLTIIERTRQWVKVKVPNNFAATYTLEVNGTAIGTVLYSAGVGFVYSPTDASTKGGGGPTASGGFKELYRNDGVYFTCTERDDDTIFVQMPIRKISSRKVNSLTLSFTRKYDDSVGATETIELYDWESASYPYGSFVTASQRTITNTSLLTTSVTITDNPGRFIDYEGTMYIQVNTGTVGGNAKLYADSLRVVLK